MATKVRRERDQQRIVVVISGALDAGAVPSFRRSLVNALRIRSPVLIDLTKARSLHRDALTTLVVADRQAERSGTQLLLRAEPTQMRAVLAAFGMPPENPNDRWRDL
jgi:anti-anti-sigma regulatory factor